MDCTGQLLHERYRVAELLGEGTEALVYRADDLRLDRPVAIKLLRPELRADPSFVARFEREARGAARLAHPHIVRIYDYGEIADGEAAGTYFLVMEYVEGGDLRDRLQPGVPLPVPIALRLAREIAEALADAHAHAIVHRDVKPANVLLTEHGQAKVTDFGIAKMLDVPSLTASAALLGTPHYLAPEQARAGAITPASDVYALGVVLFEMLAGRRPFEGESFVQVAMQHLHAEPPALETLNPAVPPDLAALVQRALAKDPEERFADGAALSAALLEEERKLGVAEPTAARAAEAPASALPAAAEMPPRGPRAAADSGRRLATLWFLGDTVSGQRPEPSGAAPRQDAAPQSAATDRLRTLLPAAIAWVRRTSPEHASALLMGLPILLGIMTVLILGPLLFGGSAAGDKVTGAALSESEIPGARLPAGAGAPNPPPTKTPAAAAATVSPAGEPSSDAPPSAGAAESPPASPPTAAATTVPVQQQATARTSPTAHVEPTRAPTEPAAPTAPPTAAARATAVPTEPPVPAAAPPAPATSEAAVIAQPGAGASGTQAAPATSGAPAAAGGAAPVEVANGVTNQAGQHDTLSMNAALAPTMAPVPTAVPTAAPTAAPTAPPTAPPPPPTAAPPPAPSATTRTNGSTPAGQAPAAAPVQPTSAPTAAPRRGARQSTVPGQPADGSPFGAPAVAPGAGGIAPRLGDPMYPGPAQQQAAPMQPGRR